MRVLNTKDTKFKSHKFKKYKTYKKCTKCNIMVHNLGSGIWVENLNEGMHDFVKLQMDQSLSDFIEKNFEPDIEIIEISNNCDDYLIKNIIE